MKSEKEFYELLTNNQHIAAVKAPWDGNVYVSPNTLEDYYYLRLNGVVVEPYC